MSDGFFNLALFIAFSSFFPLASSFFQRLTSFWFKPDAFNSPDNSLGVSFSVRKIRNNGIQATGNSTPNGMFWRALSSFAKPG